MSGGGPGGGPPVASKASVKHAALRATGGVRKEGRAAAVASLAVKALQAHAAKNLLGTGSGTGGTSGAALAVAARGEHRLRRELARAPGVHGDGHRVRRRRVGDG